MRGENVAQLLNSDISDPSDFPPLLARPGLRDLDSSLRCGICGDFYDAPVTLGCGHCFCSLCIRNALATKAECPHCRKPASESHLRADPAIEQVVLAWKTARSCVLKLLKEAADGISPQTNDGEASSSSRPAKKRRRTQSTSPQREGASSDVEIIPPPIVDRKSSSSSKPLRPRSESRKKSSTNPIPTSDSGEEEIPSTSKGDLTVKCPICSQRVSESKINLHLDSGCKAGTGSDNNAVAVTQWGKLLIMGASRSGKEKQRLDADLIALPKAAYGTLKDKQLKAMLVEHELPTTGDRNTWIARHEQWVMLYNANLDKSIKHRRSIEQIRTDLRKWEDARKTKKVTIEDVEAYEKQHKSEFARLIEVARPKKVPPPPPPLKSELSSATLPSSPHTKASSPLPSSPIDDGSIVPDSEEERSRS
ncbi:hypothetical protein HGRIS_013606 [Hohenbuehelia grisea]|uniref:RING-type domain-containing protein n=1 Tax=Hohenbuehelia grisea TaxID=104357 RepID=A0ABR3IW01_9AGAR